MPAEALVEGLRAVLATAADRPAVARSTGSELREARNGIGGLKAVG